MSNSDRSGYRRLIHHDGRSLYLHEQTVLAVAPSVKEGCCVVYTTASSATAIFTVSGTADEVFAALFPGPAADADLLRDMREVYTHIRQGDVDEAEIRGAEAALHLLATRRGLEWKP